MANDGDEEDEGGFGGLYESGHWVWDDHSEALLFVSDLPPTRVEAVQIITKAPAGTIEFRDDIDLIEQIRYRRRYQRKLQPGEADLITLQDVKDIALYTAPMSILSLKLIELLHLPTTERFLRALIFCCAYYLQVSDIMTGRIIELATKVRTPDCEILEKEFRDNLSDLRLLVAKEYCVMLVGGGDTKRFHHMGPNKKRQSLSDKDARLFETFLRVSVQIVYLALGRRNFPQIELECHRILKSDIFNSVEHTLKTNYIAKMMPEEREVLLGACVHHDKKLNTCSPLMNEVFCERPIDFRLMGLGVIKYENLPARYQYLYLIIAGPEEKLKEWNITVGVIGMKRSLFDTMLRPVYQTPLDGRSRTSISSQSGQRSALRKSVVAIQRIYPEIRFPEEHTTESTLPSDFPQKPEDIPPICITQLRRWRNRFMKLTNATVPIAE